MQVNEKGVTSREHVDIIFCDSLYFYFIAKGTSLEIENSASELSFWEELFLSPFPPKQSVLQSVPP